jgi:hypothetical protein
MTDASENPPDQPELTDEDFETVVRLVLRRDFVRRCLEKAAAKHGGTSESVSDINPLVVPPEPVPDVQPVPSNTAPNPEPPLPAVNRLSRRAVLLAAVVVLALFGLGVYFVVRPAPPAVGPVDGPGTGEGTPTPERRDEGPPSGPVPEGATPSRIIEWTTALVGPDGSEIVVLGPNRPLTEEEQLQVTVRVATSRSRVVLFQIDPPTAALGHRDTFTRGADGTAAGRTMGQPTAKKADEVFVLIAADPETAERVGKVGAFVSPADVQEARAAADPEAALRALVLAALSKAECNVPHGDVLVRCGGVAHP